MKPTPSKRELLVKELVAARHARNLSRRDIARAANVSHSLIDNIENTVICASPHILQTYSRLCGLKLDSLLLAWNHPPEDIIAKLQARPELCDMIRAA